MASTKKDKRRKIRYRIRKKISGTATNPRIAVFRSNKNVYCQVIDDVNGTTLISVSSKGQKMTGSKIDQAKEIGKKVGAEMKAAKIDMGKFDRGGFLYHGRVKAMAEGIREAGINL